MGQPSPFTSPAAPGVAGVAPKIYELAGCLVAFSPTALTKAGEGDNKTGYGKDEPRDRITTNIFVLETPGGQPVSIGRTEPTSAPTHMMTGPARFQGVWMSSQNIVAALAPGGQPLVGAMILGRIVRSDVGNKPWNLVAVDGTPDMDRAIQIWSALQIPNSGVTYNEPTPLNPTVAPPANVVQYGYAPSSTPPQPTAWTVPPVPQPPVPQPIVVQPPSTPALPPHLAALGWTLQSWAGLTSEQQGQVLAATPVA